MTMNIFSRGLSQAYSTSRISPPKTYRGNAIAFGNSTPDSASLLMSSTGTVTTHGNNPGVRQSANSNFDSQKSPGQGGRPSQKRDYNYVARRVIAIMTTLPLVLVLGYKLLERAAGKPQRRLAKSKYEPVTTSHV